MTRSFQIPTTLLGLTAVLFISSTYARTSKLHQVSRSIATTRPGIHGITVRTIAKKSEKPIDLTLEYVEFEGTDKSVTVLNKAVQDLWQNDQGCDINEIPAEQRNTVVGDYSHSLSIVKFNEKYAILDDSGSATCPGTAHPDNWHLQHIIETATGKTFHIAEILSATEKQKILPLFSAIGSKLRSDGDAECAAHYELEELKGSTLQVLIKDGTVSIQPNFGHAEQACEEELTLPMSQFKDIVSKNDKILSVLNSLK